ncbi:MAG: dethiobiotin synthase [Spirochaetales bacterium]|nr:dethiobiotin synthase [Spirochaetales bacterium]
MSNGLFITATSTGIGKTVVSAVLCRILLRAGFSVCYYKPVQTGAAVSGGRLVSQDAAFVENFAGASRGLKTHFTYLFKKPASPHYAAKLESGDVNLVTIITDYHSLSQSHDYTIVEGAGGLYVPLNDNGVLMADVPEALELGIILAANAGLGTINHTGLSCDFARRRNIPVRAVILISHEEQPTPLERENREVLVKLTGIKDIYLISAAGGVDVDKNLTGELEQSIDQFPPLDKIRGWMA